MLTAFYASTYSQHISCNTLYNMTIKSRLHTWYITKEPVILFVLDSADESPVDKLLDFQRCKLCEVVDTQTKQPMTPHALYLHIQTNI